MAIKDYEFWFVVGTQFLYGEEIFDVINDHAAQMAAEWSEKLPCKVVAKPCVKTSKEILTVMQQANNDEKCAGVITWMHTFSPSKMWIAGFNALEKPYLHVNTQFNRDIPWDDIDMDFMNLNQSAHGDREHGYIAARMRLKQKVVAGYWKDETFQNKMGVWMRAAVGAAESRKLRVLRISDNMRNVAVTDGDKIEAQIKLGWQVDHYGVGDIIKLVDAVTEDEIDAQMAEYNKWIPTISTPFAIRRGKRSLLKNSSIKRDSAHSIQTLRICRDFVSSPALHRRTLCVRATVSAQRATGKLPQ